MSNVLNIFKTYRQRGEKDGKTFFSQVIQTMFLIEGCIMEDFKGLEESN